MSRNRSYVNVNKTQHQELVMMYQRLEQVARDSEEDGWGEDRYANKNAGPPSFLPGIPGKDFGTAYVALLTPIKNFPGVDEELSRRDWEQELADLEKETRGERVLNRVQKNDHVKKGLTMASEKLTRRSEAASADGIGAAVEVQDTESAEGKHQGLGSFRLYFGAY